MKFCQSCGAANANAAKFCSNCGQAFSESDSATDASRRASESSKRPRSGERAASGFAAFARLVGRVVKPILTTAFAFLRDMAVRALSPSSTWNIQSPPNFLYWALVQCALLRFPTAIVGIVYAALANDARRRGALDDAFERAKAARIWLLVDLALVAAIRIARFIF